jgi:predicted 3-demethylubiquinone-9 3-methyltransferase (glyoxalase superfamily)
MAEPIAADPPRLKGLAIAKNTICLWYDKDAEAAARFYAERFPDSVSIVRRPLSEDAEHN